MKNSFEMVQNAKKIQNIVAEESAIFSANNMQDCSELFEILFAMIEDEMRPYQNASSFDDLFDVHVVPSQKCSSCPLINSRLCEKSKFLHCSVKKITIGVC